MPNMQHSCEVHLDEEGWQVFFIGKDFDGKELFADCLLLGTRQRLCRVLCRPSAKKIAVTARAMVTVTVTLPSAAVKELSKSQVFVECNCSGTWQSLFLCRVLW
jgi:hypothetical protein